MRAVVIWRVLYAGLAAALLAGCGTQPSAPPSTTTSPGKDWSEHTQGLPFVIGYEKGLAEARSQHKPAMMFVTTTWCGWCKKLADDDFTDSEIRSLLSNFVCVIVDGDVEQDAEKKLGATQGYPTIIFLSPDGKKLAECLGYQSPAEFKSIVEKALDAYRSG